MNDTIFYLFVNDTSGIIPNEYSGHCSSICSDIHLKPYRIVYILFIVNRIGNFIKEWIQELLIKLKTTNKNDTR